MSEIPFEWVTAVNLNDVLGRLTDESCPRPVCDGALHRDEYKDAPAVVCERCEVPAARLWGDNA